MATGKKTRSSRKKSPKPKPKSSESRSSDALTVAWTVSLTAVLLCNAVVLLAAWAVDQEIGGDQINVFLELVLFFGATTGILSLVLLPMVMRVRRVPPPQGLVVFGICIAAAPVLVVLARTLR